MTQSTQIELFIYGRLSHCHVHTPFVNRKDPTKPPTFCTHVLLDENHPGEPGIPQIKTGAQYIQSIKDAQRTIAQAAWPKAGWENMLQSLQHKDKLALHNGTLSKPKDEQYHGLLYISANNKKKPRLLESRGANNVELVAADGRPYSGGWGIVHIAMYAQSPEGRPSDHGERINCQLMGIQWVKHDAAFGGGGRISEMSEYGVIASEADAPAPAAQSTQGRASLF